MKGQAATELLTVIGVGLAIIIPLFYFSLYSSWATTSQAMARQAVDSIADSADYVYSFGNQSSLAIKVRIPKSVVSSLVSDRTVLLRISTTAGVSDVFAVTKSNVAGSIPTAAGEYLIKLENLGGFVNVSW